MEMLPKLKDVNNLFMKIVKILKIISIISFLLICSPDKEQLPVFIYLLLFLYQFMNDIISISFSEHNIFWEGLAVIPIIGTITIYLRSAKYEDRYLILFCFIALTCILITSMIVSPALSSYKGLLQLSFCIPAGIFIVSSIFSVYLLFRKGKL
jgi:hypothetical protein